MKPILSSLGNKVQVIPMAFISLPLPGPLIHSLKCQKAAKPTQEVLERMVQAGAHFSLGKLRRS